MFLKKKMDFIDNIKGYNVVVYLINVTMQIKKMHSTRLRRLK